MSRTLYIAAGGGGDALAALMLARMVDASDQAPVVLSYSWDRHLIDPAPGPRSVNDFDSVGRLTPKAWEVTAESTLSAGGVSGLTLLARHTPARYVLMDPVQGAQGIRDQLRELIEHLAVNRLMLVDVGGDIAAHGDEPTLLSPLGDSLALAATAGLPVPTEVAIIGVGLDGELPQANTREDLTTAGATARRLEAADVRDYLRALEHHPSEATMLVAGAAMGLTGRAEIRDKGALVQVTDQGADAFLATHDAILKLNTVAQKLIETRSFEQAETITKEVCGRTELDHERRKAHSLARNRPDEPDADELRNRLQQYFHDAALRGATLVSFRRLTEVLGKHHYDPPAVRELIGNLAIPDLPLCLIAPNPEPQVRR